MSGEKPSWLRIPVKPPFEKPPTWREMPIAGIIPAEWSTEINKMHAWRTHRPVIDQEKCVRCRTCWVYCPDGAIEELDKEYVTSSGRKWTVTYEVNYDYCKGCGVCAEVCPVKAIRMELELR